MTDKTGIFRAQRSDGKGVVEGYYYHTENHHIQTVERHREQIETHFYFIDPNTLEYLGGEGCEYCKDIPLGEFGKPLKESYGDGEMCLYHTAWGAWHIRSRRRTNDGEDLFSLYDTDRCFNCGKRLEEKGDC